MSNTVIDDSIGQRLREERQRLKLTQAHCGDIGQVTRESQRNYEIAKRSPNNAYWQAMAKEGMDIQYILTGEASLNLHQIKQRFSIQSNDKTDICFDILQVVRQIRDATEKHQNHIHLLEDKLKKFQADINNGVLDQL